MENNRFEKIRNIINEIQEQASSELYESIYLDIKTLDGEKFSFLIKKSPKQMVISIDLLTLSITRFEYYKGSSKNEISVKTREDIFFLEHIIRLTTIKRTIQKGGNDENS